jgi:hypothetical protein
MYNSRRQTMMILNKSFTWFLKTGLKTVWRSRWICLTL